MPQASLVISFYKRLDYLKLLFAGLKRQSFRDFEIIIADDGSPENIVHSLEILMNEIPFASKHLWHEDKGFRKNRILNQAIESSESDYLIFIDGDCVPHSRFVEEHLKQSEKNICLTGRRVNLSDKITAQLTPKKIENGFLESLPKLVIDGVFGKSFDVEKGFYFKNDLLRNFFNKKRRGILGCNFSLHKKDMLAINGFDERYEAPSIGEDSDVQFRLELNGVEVKSLNNIAVQYHLFHKLQERPQKNLDLFEKIKEDKRTFTEFGIRRG